jgi:hypothetical protein
MGSMPSNNISLKYVLILILSSMTKSLWWAQSFKMFLAVQNVAGVCKYNKPRGRL